MSPGVLSRGLDLSLMASSDVENLSIYPKHAVVLTFYGPKPGGSEFSD